MCSLCWFLLLLFSGQQPTEGLEGFGSWTVIQSVIYPFFVWCLTCVVLPHQQVLDIPRTLEYLETQGVCVAAYGADEFPAFFSRHSGCKAPCRVETPEQ